MNPKVVNIKLLKKQLGTLRALDQRNYSPEFVRDLEGILTFLTDTFNSVRDAGLYTVKSPWYFPPVIFTPSIPDTSGELMDNETTVAKLTVDGLDVLEASGYVVSDSSHLSYMQEHGEPLDDWVFNKCATWEELYNFLAKLTVKQRSHYINVMTDEKELAHGEGIGLSPENVIIDENEIVLLLEG